jgi:hypothetical protein
MEKSTCPSSIKHQRAHICLLLQGRNSIENMPAMKTDGIGRSKLNQQLIIHCGIQSRTQNTHLQQSYRTHVCVYISENAIAHYCVFPIHRRILFLQAAPGIIGISIQMSASSSMRIELVILFAFGGDKFVYWLAREPSESTMMRAAIMNLSLRHGRLVNKYTFSRHIKRARN